MTTSLPESERPAVNRAGNDHLNFVGWKADFWSPKDGFGFDRVLPLARKLCQGRGVDIGGACNGRVKESPIPGAEIVDLAVRDSGSCSNLKRFEDGSLDFIFSSHTLEHTIEVERSFAEMSRVLKPGGTCLLYLPHETHPEWNPKTNPAVRNVHRWQPDYNGVGRLFLFSGLTPIYMEPQPDVHFGWLAIARK